MKSVRAFVKHANMQRIELRTYRPRIIVMTKKRRFSNVASILLSIEGKSEALPQILRLLPTIHRNLRKGSQYLRKDSDISDHRQCLPEAWPTTSARSIADLVTWNTALTSATIVQRDFIEYVISNCFAPNLTFRR
jgi:hypothetical protein